jgi:hypothetical protein
VYLWMPMAGWGVGRLIRALIGRQPCISYGRAPARVAVWDNRPDGTMLHTEVPAGQELSSGAHETTRGKPC